MKLFQINDGLAYVPEPYVKKNSFIGQEPDAAPLPVYDEIRDLLPKPVWEGHPDALACYDYAWKIAFRNLRKADKKAGFVSDFIDTAFNGYLFMWDSSFIMMFGKYASRIFDFQKTLDNFYAHQHVDGFICREICETEPGEQWERFDPCSTGPNVLPWAEWVYYCSTGDRERLSRVFDPLMGYHNWMRLYRSWPDGTYWSSGWGCGMDNLPRIQEGYNVSHHHGFMSWIDACAQAYLSATVLIEMAGELGREGETAELEREREFLYKVVNESMWDEEKKFYFDRFRDGTLSDVKHAGAYWTLLAEMVPEERRDAFVAHLDDENEFRRPNRVPALSADHPDYLPCGGYWRGNVWAPTNYMVLCALHRYGYDDLAFDIAKCAVDNVAEVFAKDGTIYENYAPESARDGGRVKDDFVGWSGLFPISMMFEYVFGIQPDAQAHAVEWNVRLTEEHGVRQYPLGDATLDLICRARASEDEEPEIEAVSDRPVTLKVRWKGGEKLLSL